jgi:hypothetical protein
MTISSPIGKKRGNEGGASPYHFAHWRLCFISLRIRRRLGRVIPDAPWPCCGGPFSGPEREKVEHLLRAVRAVV